MLTWRKFFSLEPAEYSAVEDGKDQAMRTRIGRRPLLLATGAALVLALGGCAYQGDGIYDGYYDGYYDGFYGPYAGGYWAIDGFFYYWRDGQRYHRDDGRHFRRDRFPGGHRFQGDRDGPHRGPRGPHSGGPDGPPPPGRPHRGGPDGPPPPPGKPPGSS